MDDHLARIIASVATFEELAQFEKNAKQRGALNNDLRQALEARSAELGRKLIIQRLVLTDLSPAQQKIVQVVSEYVGLMKREGKAATRTLMQLKNRGLIASVEVSVAKSKPTQGFQTLADANLVGLSYEQIIVDHPDEFSSRALWYARRTLGMTNDSDLPPVNNDRPVQRRTNDFLAWLRARSTANGGILPPHTNAEAAAALGISAMRVFGNVQSRIDFACYQARLPPLGLSAAEPFAMAWRRQDREWAFPISSMQAATRSRIWSAPDFETVLRETKSLSGQAHVAWKEELRTNEAAVRSWAFGLQAGGGGPSVPSVDLDGTLGRRRNPATSTKAVIGTPYWVFVCNPKKWAIDEFFDNRIDHDTWGIRPADRERFAPGQLGIVRVGVDHRSAAQRKGKPQLASGIYALCQVESGAFEGAGADSRFWAPGAGRSQGWPTVNLRYLRTYAANPLTIERLRTERPNVSHLLLSGFQAASFPIPAHDFHAVMTLLGEDLDDLPTGSGLDAATPAQLAELERKYLHASPEVKVRVSRFIERGPVGGVVKKITGFKCQVCAALGCNSIGFLKSNGEPYVEAHHVMPVSLNEVGSLSASNVMTVCANHHRQLHYGGIPVAITDKTFELTFPERILKIPRIVIDTVTSVAVFSIFESENL